MGEQSPPISSSVRHLIERDDFLRALFQSIPCGILVVDKERRVCAFNPAVERAFGIKSARVIDKRTGEALRCVHATESEQGCGFAEHCRTCRVRLSAEAALGGQPVHRSRAELRLHIGARVEERAILLTASAVTHQGQKLALVLLEDLTELPTQKSRLFAEHSFSGIIGKDPKMLAVFDTIRELADVDAPVLIQGESGTGKELVASAIHNEGSRASKLFVPVNSSALPESLLESELFGHVTGAFTGAIRDKKGRFELADEGTIFLDEVGELSPAVQVKLLRVLQQGMFERLGSEQTVRVDARVISATHKDLRQEVAAGRFREDLFYRLCVVPIQLPPLRDRRSDIPLLIDHFLAQRGTGLRANAKLSSQALELMLDYDWPGNVRELQNSLQYSLIMCKGDVIEPEHLPSSILRGSFTDAAAHAYPRRRKLTSSTVRRALNAAGGNRSAAARILGVGRATLYRFLAEHGLKGGS